MSVMTKQFKWMIKAYGAIMWLLVAIRIDLIEILEELWNSLCLI